ncbi:hypothetical protein HYS48_04895 [Candidatus Woesearchaeota archaeon]|nr:hypothetical protein [Candidatus Woesearchaeota archaeon]
MGQVERTREDKAWTESVAAVGKDLLLLPISILAYCISRSRLVKVLYTELPPHTPLSITYDPYKVRKTKEEGERDLIRLAREIPTEGSWLYSPADSYWYHISYGHREETVDGSERFASLQWGQNFAIFGQILFEYHTHPRVAGKYIRGSILELILQDLRDDKWDEEAARPLARKAIDIALASINVAPSVEDIQTYIRQQRRFDKIQLQWCIASPVGITRVDILDPTLNTVAAYKNMLEAEDAALAKLVGKHITMTEEGNFAIRYQQLFDSVNELLRGRMQFHFSPAKDYGL